MIIECHVRSDLSRSIRFVTFDQICHVRRKSQSNCYFKFLPRYFTFLPAISLFCPLFHFFARYFNKNSKATDQSDLRKNAKHVIRVKIRHLKKWEMHYSRYEDSSVHSFRQVWKLPMYLQNINNYHLFTPRRATKAFYRTPKTMFLAYFHDFAGTITISGLPNTDIVA